MNLNELAAEVYTITNRPDLVAETSLAIRKSTMKMHSIDFFKRDLQEISLSVPVPSMQIQVDINAQLPRLRGIAYIRNNSSTGGNVPNPFFEPIDPRQLLDSYGQEISDIYYQGGQTLNIKSRTLVSNLLVGYYQAPVVSLTGYSSWIAVEQPYAIIEDAAATIFRMVGNLEQAKLYEASTMQNVILLRQNYLEGVAR